VTVPRRWLAPAAAALLGLAGCVAGTDSTRGNAQPADGTTAGPQAPPTTRLGAPASPSAPGSRSAPPAGRGVTLLFTGDMLVSDDLRAQAARNAGGHGYDFMPMLRVVAPIVASADWSICHQETPISPDNRLLSGYPAFSAPRELAQAEKAVGYDACTTASNHTVDHGAAGVQGTLDTFDRVGIRHVGSARTATESRQLTIYTVRGLRIGHLAYAYGLNGIQPPTPWTVNLIDPARIRADARRIRAAGAQFVLVSLHFGNEKQQTPSAYQQQVAAAVMASPDVDLIVGHHAHVVQPILRRPDGRWVIFGVGNFLAQQEVTPPNLTPPHRDGVIVRVTITPGSGGRWRVSRVGYVPTFVTAPSDVIQLAPPFSRSRTAAVLTAYHAPLVDDTPR
jgi:poly-gamma-glutamate capsule biosynthesis protein CapA/YwtB (metallophosphatase superfamily)